MANITFGIQTKFEPLDAVGIRPLADSGIQWRMQVPVEMTRFYGTKTIVEYVVIATPGNTFSTIHENAADILKYIKKYLTEELGESEGTIVEETNKSITWSTKYHLLLYIISGNAVEEYDKKTSKFLDRYESFAEFLSRSEWCSDQTIEQAYQYYDLQKPKKVELAAPSVFYILRNNDYLWPEQMLGVLGVSLATVYGEDKAKTPLKQLLSEAHADRAPCLQKFFTIDEFYNIVRAVKGTKGE